MSRVKGEVRTSQLILTYGVGAMVAMDEGSYIVAGLDHWEVDEGDVLREPRLERLLGVERFQRPPAGGDRHHDVPVRRFPEQYSCPQCHRLGPFWTFGGARDTPTCPDCPGEPALIPSRFVMACARGHIDDFPYSWWVHRDRGHEGPAERKLRIEARGLTAGLGDVIVSCECGARSSLEGALGARALSGVGSCRGPRPWLDSADATCGETVRGLQRGASNVWFAVSRSAISIPPWSEGVYRLLDRYWRVLRAMPEESLAETIERMGLASGDYSVEDLHLATLERRSDQESPLEEVSLKQAEYEALTRGRPEIDRRQQFVCTAAPDPGEEAQNYFTHVQRVPRLRMVKALEGFTRLRPPGDLSEDSQESFAGIAEGDVWWLPAIEIIGEGVFLTLDSSRLGEWEERPDVIERVARINDNVSVPAGTDPSDRRSITPRLVLVHTLAHAMVDQWALECGYPAASLAERLFVDDTSAGFLVYTATTDSAGSLGGVVAMLDNGRLDASLEEAVARAAWCSADPLCIESDGRGVDAQNLAACHSCVLLPETSCEERNVFLDRALLVGTPETPEIGFFRDLLQTP